MAANDSRVEFSASILNGAPTGDNPEGQAQPRENARAPGRAASGPPEQQAADHHRQERGADDFEAIAAGFGLTALQARTLLWLEEPSAMSSLAEHLQCDASNVTGLADRLDRLGLVTRVPGADRRVKLLSLTPAGLQTRTSLARKVAAGSTVTARLTPAQRRQLSDLLDLLLD